MQDKRFKRNQDIVFRKIASEVILVPIRQKIADLQNIFSLNEVGAYIWELLDGENTFSQIKEKLSNEYNISNQIAERDLNDFLQDLVANEVIDEI